MISISFRSNSCPKNAKKFALTVQRVFSSHLGSNGNRTDIFLDTSRQYLSSLVSIRQLNFYVDTKTITDII